MQKLYLDNNSITDISTLKNLKKLIELTISKNKITDICEIANLSKLKVLDISGNKITSINCLKKLDRLEKLDVSNNQLTEIPAYFQNLKFFKAENNFPAKDVQSPDIQLITELEKDLRCNFKRYSNLEQLYLEIGKQEAAYTLDTLNRVEGLKIKGFNLKKLPEKLKKLQNISVLRLPGNKIENADVIAEMSMLEALDLSENSLTNCDFLQNLQNLQKLDLSKNKLSDIGSICKLKKLVHLNLSNNKIINIDCLTSLPKLEKLDITGNKIDEIPDFEHIKDLFIGKIDKRVKGLQSPDLQVIAEIEKHLNIQFKQTDKSAILIQTSRQEANYSLNNRNQVVAIKIAGYNLRSVPEKIKELKNCEIVNLEQNKLEKIEHLDSLINLHRLILSNNNISNINFLQKIHSLQSLAIDNNKIVNISALKNLTNIKRISLNSNKITDFSSISGLKKLVEISLRDNEITEIPRDLQNSKNLKKILLDGNKIKVYDNNYPEIEISLGRNPLESLYFFTEPATGVLEVSSLSEAVVKLIKNFKSNKAGMFGIFGRWGRGKSFFWKILKKNLEQNNYKTLEFSAWKYNDTPAIWAYLYETILAGLYKKISLQKHWQIIKKNFIRNTAQFILNTILFVVLPLLLFLIFGNSIGKFFDKFVGTEDFFTNYHLPTLIVYFIVLILVYFKISELKLPNLVKQLTKRKFTDILGIQAEIEKDLEFFIKNYKKDIVLFVDDLDRCDEQNILKLIDSLRIIAENKAISDKLIIIAAIDERILKKVIRNKYQTIENDEKMLDILQQEYIEKLFIFAIKLPKLSEKQKIEVLNNFISEKVEENVSGVLEDEKNYLGEYLKQIDDITPRQIRNLYNKFIFATDLFRQKLPDLVRENKEFIAALIVFYSKKELDEKICKENTEQQTITCTIFEIEFTVSKEVFRVIVDVVKTAVAF